MVLVSCNPLAVIFCGHHGDIFKVVIDYSLGGGEKIVFPPGGGRVQTQFVIKGGKHANHLTSTPTSYYR